MAGIPKKGIEFAGWNSHIFDGDNKIDKLLDAQGWDGFAVYFFLCQRAYATDGYFYRWSYDDAATTARRMAGGIRSETVKGAVGTCSRVGLFDKRLLDAEGILTSRGIQRRFVTAIQKRSYRTVNKRYWLLDEAETAAGRIVFEKAIFPGVGDSYAENANVLPENSHVLPEDSHKSIEEKSTVFHYTRAHEGQDASRMEDDAGYERFLLAYPKVRGDPAKNYFAFHQAIESGATLDQMLSALEWQRTQPEWTERGGQYIPSPEKWLRNRGWTQKRLQTPLGNTRHGRTGNIPAHVDPSPQEDAERLENMRRMYAYMVKNGEHDEKTEKKETHSDD